MPLGLCAESSWCVGQRPQDSSCLQCSVVPGEILRHWIQGTSQSRQSKIAVRGTQCEVRCGPEAQLFIKHVAWLLSGYFPGRREILIECSLSEKPGIGCVLHLEISALNNDISWRWGWGPMRYMYVIDTPCTHTLTVIFHSGFSMSYEVACGVLTCSILWHSRNFKFWITLDFRCRLIIIRSAYCFVCFFLKWECLNLESQTHPSNKTAKLSSPRLQSNFQFMCEGHRTCKIHTPESHLVATWGGTGSQALCQPQASTAGVN